MDQAIAQADPLAHLPDNVQALTPPRQAAWIALAEGCKLRDAAAAADVPVGTIWRWMRDEPFKSAKAHRMIVHMDSATDTVGNALKRGESSDDDKAIANGLKAATMVFRALGMAGEGGAVRAHATTTVNVAVQLGSVLSSRDRVTTTVDVPPELGDHDTVADTQPRRSVTSSRKPTGR